MGAFRKSCLYILAGALAFFPVLMLGSQALGLRLYLRHSSACAIILAVLCVACVILSERREDQPSLPRRICADLLCPLAILCWIVFLIKGMTLTVLICMAICLICAIVLCSGINAGRGKLAGMIVGILAAIPLCLLSGLDLLFSGLVYNTVVQTLSSPDGQYYAQVIDSDQGALGGDTLVEVHSRPCLDAGLFCIAQTPQCVFAGDWGIWKTMEITWQDYDTLIINGEAYDIE